MNKRQALNSEDFSSSDSLKFQPLSIHADEQNRESIHYARGKGSKIFCKKVVKIKWKVYPEFRTLKRCQSILRGYLSDIDTSLEYSTEDALRNVDNPLLLKAQSVIEVGLRRTNLREELYCQIELENCRISSTISCLNFLE